MTDELITGAWIRQRRKKLGLTQQELADLTGYSLSYIRKLERGERVSPAAARRLQYALLRPFAFPLSTTPLFGRARELTAITERLMHPAVRMVTLTGPPGIGKTRLGQQLLLDLHERFADGAFFIDLAPLTDPKLVIPTIAASLGIAESPGQAALEYVRGYLHNRHILLMLDNFEQVLAAAPVITELMQSAPGLKVLVTSREKLQLSAEHEFAILPLPLPDLANLPPLELLAKNAAVALFSWKIRAVQSEFELTGENALAIASPFSPVSSNSD